jgi:hypothetical protein
MSPTATKDAPSLLAVPAPGILAWGQSGAYNGVDDREVILALYASGRGQPRGGLVIAPTLVAGSALSFTIGAWAAVVDCGDGTKAVIGSRATTSIDISAGGGSARADVLWADINPDAATYQVGIITEAAMAGRAGVYLGLILVPAGAGTSAACDPHPANARVLGMGKATFPETNSNKLATTTHSQYTIPAYDAEVGAVYQLELWGSGVNGASGTRALIFNATVGTTTSSESITIGSSAFAGFNAAGFRCQVRLRLICKSVGASATWVIEMDALMAVTAVNVSPQNTNFAAAVVANPGSSVITQDSTRDFTMTINSQWATGPDSASYVAKVAQAGRVA